MLTTNELPSSSGSWQLERQGVFNSASPDSGQRVWMSSDHKGLEVDVIGTGATAAAKAAYSAWKTHVAANTLSHVKTTACSTGAPPNCAIKTGTTADGKNEVVLSFQHLSALVAVVIASQGSVDANVVQQVGYAELKHLDAVLGGAPAPAGGSAAGNAAFAVPVTDAAAAARALADQAQGRPIKSGSLTVWQNDGLTLNGYGVPATPTSVSGSVYFVTSKSKNVDFLAFAVKDTKGRCAGGVLTANKNTTAVAKTTVFPAVSGSCTGSTVGAQAGY